MRAAPLSRRALLAGFAAVAVLPNASALASDGQREVSMEGWADIELTDGDNHVFRVGDTGARFTLIKLWANWCSVCLRELRGVAALQAELAPQDVDVVLVSHPSDWARNQNFARAHGLSVRCARPSASNSASAVQAALVSPDGAFYVPRSLLYRQASRSVVWSHVGGIDWTDPDTTAPFRRWIG